MTRSITHVYIIIAAMFFVMCGCAGGPRVSYDVAENFRTPNFNALTLVNNEIAVLPVMSRAGLLEDSEFGANEIYEAVSSMRPDLNFTTRENFENAFPPRFDRRRFQTFYGQIFRNELDSLVALDSVWEFIAQPYFIAFMIRDGAQLQNLDNTHFKHMNFVCEIWDANARRVVWRTSCKAVSDDADIPDRKLLAECIHRIMMIIPVAAPTTTGVPIPPGVVVER